MEYIYSYLEEEALETAEEFNVRGYIARQSSTEELSLLIAEFSILDKQLLAVAEKFTMSSTVLIRDSVLQNLIDETDDLRHFYVYLIYLI